MKLEVTLTGSLGIKEKNEMKQEEFCAVRQERASAAAAGTAPRHQPEGHSVPSGGGPHARSRQPSAGDACAVPGHGAGSSHGHDLPAACGRGAHGAAADGTPQVWEKSCRTDLQRSSAGLVLPFQNSHGLLSSAEGKLRFRGIRLGAELRRWHKMCLTAF